MASDEQTTGTGDVVYDLVSVLYHSLQGAEIYEEFSTDADEAGSSARSRRRSAPAPIAPSSSWRSASRPDPSGPDGGRP